MGRIYWVTDCSREVPAWDLQGPEADSVGSMGLDVFRKRLRRFRDELKDLLRNQEFLAGIGNAYSDEMLWEARLLPLRRRASLKPEDEEALYRAIPLVLSRAVEAILANPNYEESKQDRSFMAVHMKGGKTCPPCGHRISQTGSHPEPLIFRRGCQRQEGRPLAGSPPPVSRASPPALPGTARPGSATRWRVARTGLPPGHRRDPGWGSSAGGSSRSRPGGMRARRGPHRRGRLWMRGAQMPAPRRSPGCRATSIRCRARERGG